ncbi:cobalamin biosynthesis bifunctional protein CbiET [Brevirhabdus pacifica]|uniref:Cobalamin biosynthesis bifunctional protein CbiET n=1 Tax=Brevirhabdus pacifica TaxID=1267768 RepID=A0A1U7DKV9_9RHOB|nr:precorrin-6y C5,15-methyltransferase (decarboxylating) subunit CbiE [Brevirhabdus pacifica]APX90508.1 cobalamin biosynthesis bifunctional protein CbiET [Brevirhabdus pacifica]OWU78481.1 precorrin-6Y C5,15-methyltransferase [Loktanella sp. 22II-4b]PJJ85378.1 precorrin-6Y C5,15-methyltransferase (decarboxylating) [Brevirhabdus pacifica]
MTPWLHVIGIGEDGWDGLAPATQAILEAAEVVVGGDRHHGLAPHLTARRMHWPSPFRAMVDEIGALRGTLTCVLVTGDPLWFSAGAFFAKAFDADELVYHPCLSAFQWAAARMRWSLADLDAITVHGRPSQQAIPHFFPGARLLLLTQDGSTPATIAAHLRDNGYGDSRMTVLGALGGPDESRRDGLARDWSGDSPDFHVLAIEVVAQEDARPLPRWGLPDDAFHHDGKMTKRELRVLTLAALAPRRGQRLWDIGCGCGSVAIEWLRADRDMEATGLEPDADRRAMAASNAQILGTPRLRLSDVSAPEGLAGLPTPDAVFIGGGLSVATAEIALAALPRHGRLVANAVTLESEAILTQLHQRHGGSLIRVAVQRAEAIGRLHGWRPAMPVTQWSLMK